MTNTFADLLCGGGGFALGAIEAGLVPAWSVEMDNDIAGLYEKNVGSHVIRARIQDVDYKSLPQVYHLHMSPICTNASQAKSDGTETENDLSIADACVRAIKEVRPVNISLENVYPYRHFESFKRICNALTQSGYNFKYWNLNAADYGVPQTRRRLILLGSRVKQVRKPKSTHYKPENENNGQARLFRNHQESWRGWFETIEDLIPQLPDSEFAEWQLKRLPAETTSLLVDSAGFVDSQGRLPIMRKANEPSATIISNYTQRKLRAFIVGDQHSHNGQRVMVRGADLPAFVTDTRPANKTRAWLDSGRVVAMTVRALARFQSFPDSYEFAGKASLDCKVIGNAVPPRLAQAWLESVSGS